MRLLNSTTFDVIICRPNASLLQLNDYQLLVTTSLVFILEIQSAVVTFTLLFFSFARMNSSRVKFHETRPEEVTQPYAAHEGTNNPGASCAERCKSGFEREGLEATLGSTPTWGLGDGKNFSFSKKIICKVI